MTIGEDLAELVDPIWRRVRPATRLARLVRDYPAYAKPYPGDPYALSDAQRQANLDHFLAGRAERLARIAALLGEFGMDAAPVFSADGDARPFLEQLDAWARREWPKLPGIGAMTDARVRCQDIAYGPDAPALSMLLDVATLLGEYLVVRRTDYRWALDDDKLSKRLLTTTWGRVVVFRPAVPERKWRSAELDVEAEVIFTCNQYFRHRFWRAAISRRGVHQGALDHAEGRHDPID